MKFNEYCSKGLGGNDGLTYEGHSYTPPPPPPHIHTHAHTPHQLHCGDIYCFDSTSECNFSFGVDLQKFKSVLAKRIWSFIYVG